MTKTFTLEIHGTGTHNRGAELMAIAIRDRMRKSFPDVRLVVPAGFGGFDERAKYGFWTTPEFSGRRRLLPAKTAMRIGGSGARNFLGVVDPKEIDVVLDASGFAFSDQWGPAPAKHLFRKMNSRDRASTPLIMLPQAFGAFKNPVVANWTKMLTGRASLIYARDSQSHDALYRLGVAKERLRLYPDFTIGISPGQLPELHLPGKFVAIVPNFRMMDKGTSPSGYLRFLLNAIKFAQQQEIPPVFILHDAHEDQKVVAKLKADGCDIPAIQHSDPVVLKAVLGQASFVIGSRFHAIVSSFAQGIPCIGAGWSHKYTELFHDFDCQEFLVDDVRNTALLKTNIAILANQESRNMYHEKINHAASRVKQLNDEMWCEVAQVIHNAVCKKKQRVRFN
ncbi:MAG: polysaccharide pyruvyl transferase family protein [Novipirellula sp. JB048]